MLRTIWKRFNSTEITQLGRWNIETCKKRMDRKIDMANVDHCGVCVEKVESSESDANNHEAMIHVYMYLDSV